MPTGGVDWEGVARGDRVGVTGGDWVGDITGLLHADWTITTARNAQRILRRDVFIVSSSGDKNQNMAMIGLGKSHFVESAVHR
jgi:hypothetical protein